MQESPISAPLGLAGELDDLHEAAAELLQDLPLDLIDRLTLPLPHLSLGRGEEEEEEGEGEGGGGG